VQEFGKMTSVLAGYSGDKSFAHECQIYHSVHVVLDRYA
jgi:hypothetical protein